RLPLIAAVIITTISLIGRRPVLLGLGLLLGASTLAQRAHDGLEPPAAGPFEGIATLVADPVDIGFGTRADVRIDGQRHELRAMNAAAGALASAAAGERVHVVGRLGPPPPDSPWLIPRHIAGRLVASQVERHDSGTAVHRAANRFRRLLDEGTDSMGEP